MNGNRFLAMAALIAGVALACPAQAQKTMYRCGNNYQDKPCDDGQQGRVVGTTGTSKPAADTAPGAAAKGGSASTKNAAEPQLPDTFAKDMQAQRKALHCMNLRKLLSEAKHQNVRARNAYLADMRRLGCAWKGSEDLDAEKKCADAGTRAQKAEACGAYAKIVQQ